MFDELIKKDDGTLEKNIFKLLEISNKEYSDDYTYN
jgi:hypothetical protein